MRVACSACLVAVLVACAAPDAPAQAADGAAVALSTADTLVKVVGGAVATAATILGLPLVYQTFRKTRAEIAKINLEAQKLAREAAGTAQSGGPGLPQLVAVNIEGEGNVVSIAVDPRLRAPLLILIDALIAAVYATIASYAVSFLLSVVSLDPLHGLAMLIVYAVLFWPVLKAALRLKKELGAEVEKPQSAVR